MKVIIVVILIFGFPKLNCQSELRPYFERRNERDVFSNIFGVIAKPLGGIASKLPIIGPVLTDVCSEVSRQERDSGDDVRLPEPADPHRVTCPRTKPVDKRSKMRLKQYYIIVESHNDACDFEKLGRIDKSIHENFATEKILQTGFTNEFQKTTKLIDLFKPFVILTEDSQLRTALDSFENGLSSIHEGEVDRLYHHEVALKNLYDKMAENLGMWVAVNICRWHKKKFPGMDFSVILKSVDFLPATDEEFFPEDTPYHTFQGREEIEKMLRILDDKVKSTEILLAL
jgi:hypothetical protein